MPGPATNGSPPAAVPGTELLRFATAGSVDDGKSTLIGRLLFDTKSILEDQLEHVERTSVERGDTYTNLALLTDGLRAEREQGITIDVAYRYFATPRRRFIIADTPGHVQYTRNMVTGASTADLAVVLVDARKGVLEQSRRHAFIASTLRVPHLVLAVNKMDLVAWDEVVFDEIVQEFSSFAAKLEIADLTAIPISALKGDNVAGRSMNMGWYGGPSLLYHLEHVHIASDRNLIDCRFPVQCLFGGYLAGQVASGVFKVGDEVVVLPSGQTTRIAGIDRLGEQVEEAYPPLSVTIRLADDLDVARGDCICRTANRPVPTCEVEAMLCWMSDRPLEPGRRYAVKHTTRSSDATVERLRYRVDVNTLHRDEAASSLELNDLGRVVVRTDSPLLADEYRRNRTTGSFLLIDGKTNDTVAAGMVLGGASVESG